MTTKGLTNFFVPLPSIIGKEVKAMKRQILVRVWQRKLTPERALNELKRAGPKFNLKEEEVLELLLALSKKEITTTEAEEEI